MKKNSFYIYFILFLLPTTAAFSLQWKDFWETPDQQGAHLLQAGNAKEAFDVFKNPDWKNVAAYRAGNYQEAYEKFSATNNSDNQYNAGNAAAYLGRFQEAIDAYTKAIALNPKNKDAVYNREIIKKLMQKNKDQDKQANNAKKNNKPDKSDKSSQADNNKKEDTKDNSKSNQQPSPSEANSQKQDKKSDNKEMSKNQNQAQANKPEQLQANTAKQQQNEDKQQALRRLADDPGGLLRQKFLRDYLRRHNDVNQGV